MTRYPEGMKPNKKGTIIFSDFVLVDQWFAAMDSAEDHRFGFNEAISFMVYCDTQKEMDTYWHKLSAVPEAEKCGWLKDRYGVSWQIVPNRLNEMMMNSSPEQMTRVTKAILSMGKLDLEELERAYKEG